MWNFRGGLFNSGGRNGRARAGVTGRDRTDSTFWLLVIVGVITFLVVSGSALPSPIQTLTLFRLFGLGSENGVEELSRKPVNV
jgi:hypothetical protein